MRLMSLAPVPGVPVLLLGTQHGRVLSLLIGTHPVSCMGPTLILSYYGSSGYDAKSYMSLIEII